MHREQLINALTAPLRTDDLFRGAWLGGADASGRADDLSDLDLVVIVNEGADEEALDRVERIASTIAPVDRRYRLPAPTWHGHEQLFLQLEGLGHAGLIDLLVIHPGDEPRWLVVERHGEPRVLFDHDGLITPHPLACDDIDSKRAARLADLKERTPMLAPLVLKEVIRGRELDALNFYHELVLRPLITILRIKHCPDRWDFGLRYLERDLPPDLYETVRNLAFVRDGADIERCCERAMQLFEEHAT